MVDQCILSWLYNTVSKDVHAIVRAPKATAYTIWHAIQDQFCDNGPVHLAYNPSYSACFFSRNSIFLSQKISQQCFSAGL
jgi:hypothetical protein